jgi:transcriptional regulator of acetoin/glycerol metabolism
MATALSSSGPELESALHRSQEDLARALRRVGELELELRQLRAAPAAASADAGALPVMRLREVEGLLVKQAMERHRGNVSRAARQLGLSRAALYRRLDRHRI